MTQERFLSYVVRFLRFSFCVPVNQRGPKFGYSQTNLSLVEFIENSINIKTLNRYYRIYLSLVTVKTNLSLVEYILSNIFRDKSNDIYLVCDKHISFI